eukprot:5456075-Pyramimonas_sp.AAC.1
MLLKPLPKLDATHLRPYPIHRLQQRNGSPAPLGLGEQHNVDGHELGRPALPVLGQPHDVDQQGEGGVTEEAQGPGGQL